MHTAGDDVKVRLEMKLGGLQVGPKSVPWEALIWVGSKQMGIKGGWDGTKATGCAQVNDSYALMSADAPEIGSGSLKCEIVLMYPDAQQPDRNLRVTKSVELTEWEDPTEESEVKGSVDHTVVGLGAYDEAVKRGFTGTVEEWLASLKGTTGTGATVASSAYDAAGNTVITWNDGKSTVVKRGEKGADGKDGGLLFPKIYMDYKRGKLVIEGDAQAVSRFSRNPRTGKLRIEI